MDCNIPSGVIWLTGLSAAGKTTIAQRLVHQINHFQYCVHLDGDAVRKIIRDDTCGHDMESRLKNAYRMSRFAKFISDQNHIVVVSTMSLFHEIHAWNRENITNYFEVFLEVDLETVLRRDPKKLYQNRTKRENIQMPGIDISPEFPKNPNLTLTNNQDLDSVEPLAKYILREFLHTF